MTPPLTCPQCGKDDVFRSRCRSAREYLAGLFFVSPFRCQFCSHRFLAFRFRRQYPKHLIDRREHLRIPVRLFLSFSGGRVRGEGTVMDISMGGCIIKSDAQVHVDDIFYLQIAIDEAEPPLELAAMVRSVSPRGIAFKFLRKAQEDRRLLAFVQARSAGQTARPHG